MQQELDAVAVGVGDLIDKRNLQSVVSSRLIIRKRLRLGMPPQVMFSKQAMGQRGALDMTTGKIIGAELFACKVYTTGDDMTVTCYHPKTSKIFPCNIFWPVLTKWISDDHNTNAKSEKERQAGPAILRPIENVDCIVGLLTIYVLIHVENSLELCLKYNYRNLVKVI